MRLHGIGMIFLATCLSAMQGCYSLPFQVNEADQSVPNQDTIFKGFAPIVKKAGPAVVSIRVVTDSPDSANPHPNMPGKQGQGAAAGSGVIISSDGYILTNSHVVENAIVLTVTLNTKEEFPATLIGTDAKTDLAVIQIDATDLPFIAWGEHAKNQVGDLVLAIGNPFGLNGTVTVGIISALGRNHVSIADFEDFIQTDASINPGNSGGALVNMRGELIGINTAIFSRTGGSAGVGFAIPATIAVQVTRKIITHGRVPYGWLAISIQPMNPSLKKAFKMPAGQEGVLVTDVDKGGPAAKAGIRQKDIILEYNGKRIESLDSLRTQVAQTEIGSRVEIKVLRSGAELMLSALIEERPVPKTLAEKAEQIEEPIPPDGSLKPNKEIELDVARDIPVQGLTVQKIIPEIIQRLGLPQTIVGVIVTNVEPGSLAEKAGLKPEDIIQEINRQPVETFEKFLEVATRVLDEEGVMLVYNKGTFQFIAFSKPQASQHEK
jgi:serine protease Do